jgi:PAS domain S-box-containing protein
MTGRARDDEALALFDGPGTARELARAVDWSATPLGPVRAWPEALRTAARLCVDSPTALCVWAGRDFSLIHNDAYLPFLGAKAAWAMGRPAREIWAEIWPVLGPEFDGVFRTGLSTRHEDARYVLRRADRDEEGFFTFTVSPIRDAAGAVVGLFNVSQETTHAVQTAARLDQELREASRRLVLATSAAAIGIYDIDVVTGAVRLDERVRELFGFGAEERVTHDALMEHVHPDDREARRAALERGLDPRGDGRYRCEYRTVPTAAGAARWIASSGQVSFDEESRPVRLVGVMQDVTARRELEEELRRAAARFERQVRLFDGVASTTPDFVYLFDLRGRFLYANRRLLEVWGMELPDIVGKTPRELGYEQWHHDLHMREIAQVVATRQPIKGEVPFRAPKTGIYGVYEYIFTPVFGADGAVETIAGTTRDVTERKQAEEAVRDAQERLSAVIEQLPVAVGVLDPGGRFVLGNEALRSYGVTALPSQDSEQRPRWTVYDEAGDELPPEAWPGARALRGEIVTSGVEAVYRRDDGSEVCAILAAVPLRKRTGEQTGIIVVIQDVTRLKRAEEELRRANQQKADFLAVLSHELRNPLAAIGNGVHLLERAQPSSDVWRRAAEVLRRQAEHLTRLVDDLLDVTRISRGRVELQRRRLDLRDVVRQTTDDLRSLFEPRGVLLRVEPMAAPAPLEGDPVRLAQVVANLLHNAAKFTPAGGTVSVALSAEGGSATVSVRDSGDGIDPGELERVFEPFVQGRQGMARTRGGLGLGLALVKAFAELHGGSVRAESAGPGRGATFEVTLPLASAAADAAPAARRPAAGPAPRDILVIEDNVDVGRTLADVLELQGHRVRVATDGRGGLELARQRPPDVILCDVGLPDMSGYDVARAVRADVALAATRLVALTGYAQPEDRRSAREAGFDAHLAKPPPLDALERLLAGG